jgi:hypothetical protein
MIRPPLTRGLHLAVLVGVLATAVPGLLSGQSLGSMVGVVLDERNGEPVVGAEVTLLGTDLKSQVNEAGEFMFPNVPAGAVSVRVERAGYTALIEQIEIQADGVADLEVRLQPIAVMIEELLVQGRRSVDPQGYAVTEVRPGREVGFTAADLLVASVPGLTMGFDQGGRGGGVSLRGASSIVGSDMPKIYVDGIAIADTPGTTQVAGALSLLRQIPARDVRSIRVLRGPAATMHPNAANGVILIETIRGLENTGTAFPPR